MTALYMRLILLTSALAASPQQLAQKCADTIPPHIHDAMLTLEKHWSSLEEASKSASYDKAEAAHVAALNLERMANECKAMVVAMSHGSTQIPVKRVETLSKLVESGFQELDAAVVKVTKGRPSSFLERDDKPESFLDSGAEAGGTAALDALVRKLKEMDKRALTTLNTPTSLLQESSSSSAQMESYKAQLQQITDEGVANMKKTLGADATRPKISFADLEKKIKALEVVTGVNTESLIEVGSTPRPTFESVQKKLDALAAHVHPSSLLEIGPSSLAQVSSGAQMQMQARSELLAQQLLAAAQNSDEVKQFDSKIDESMAALKAKLHRMDLTARDATHSGMSFAEVKQKVAAQQPQGRVPTWDEIENQYASGTKSALEWARKQQDELEAFRHHRRSSLLQTGSKAPANDGEKQLAKYMQDFHDGFEEGLSKHQSFLQAREDPSPKEAGDAGMRDLAVVAGALTKYDADETKLSEDNTRALLAHHRPQF